MVSKRHEAGIARLLPLCDLKRCTSGKLLVFETAVGHEVSQEKQRRICAFRLEQKPITYNTQ